MEFQRIQDYQPVVEYLVQAINSRLSEGQKVLWLVPGGSAISIAADVSKQLHVPEDGQLIVTLTDERYGPVNHPDSNWLQLASAGFQVANTKELTVLHNKSLEETVSDYADALETALLGADFRIGLFGMGADGHTAGILPGSPAVNEQRLASGYAASDFTRLTMTFPAIMRLDQTVVYAMGAGKKPALENLQRDIPLAVQPAQIHKKVSRCTIFNDQIGEE